MSIRLSSQEDAIDETHDINVTPFIDVVLVLLLIFMVAAPLSTVDINVDLPASTAEPAPRPDKPLFLTLKPDLSLVLGDARVERGNLARALGVETQGEKEQRIFVRAHRVVPYGEVMELMNLLHAAGYLKIGFVGLEAIPGSPAGKNEPAPRAMDTRSPKGGPAEAKP
jgi:biopolymer transport protein ExbD